MKTIPDNIILREGTYDRLIWESVYVNNEYKLPERFEPGDVVIDIGAHTGSFAAACLERGAGVHTYEADVENGALCFSNVNRLFPIADYAISSRAVAWDGYELGVMQYSGYRHPGNDQVNTGGGSVLLEDGRMIADPKAASVVCLPFREVLFLAGLLRRSYTRGESDHIRLIKLDCEGSEFPILLHAKDLSKVQEICGEYHEGYGHKREELVTCLEGHGFTVETTGPTSEGLGHFWARRA